MIYGLINIQRSMDLNKEGDGNSEEYTYTDINSTQSDSIESIHSTHSLAMCVFHHKFVDFILFFFFLVNFTLLTPIFY